MRYKAVIFDMDGTILDTIADLGDSLNYALGELGHRNDYTVKDAGSFFGSGITVACQRALAKECGFDEEAIARIGTPLEVLPEEVTAEEVAKVERIFHDYYPEHAAIKTAPFRGIPELLQKLSQEGYKLAVASNKINVAVQPLADKYFHGLFDRAIGVDETIRRKPAPDMLQKLMEEFNATPEETVLIGDTEVDIRTAANAGVDVICVKWGFRKEEDLRLLGVTDFAETADDIYQMINR